MAEEFSANTAAAYQDAPGMRRIPKILVADDDAATGAILRMALEAQGYEVIEASGGFRLIGCLLVDRPDLAILSAELSWIGSSQLCRGIRSNPDLRDIKVLFLSRENSEESFAALAAAGADMILMKPVDLDPLLETVAILAGVPAEDDDRELSDSPVSHRA